MNLDALAAQVFEAKTINRDTIRAALAQVRDEALEEAAKELDCGCPDEVKKFAVHGTSKHQRLNACCRDECCARNAATLQSDEGEAVSYTPEQLRSKAMTLVWRNDAHEERTGQRSQSMEEGVRQLRAHAAALEENAKLRKHAEAMANARENPEAYCPEVFSDFFDVAYDAYRADFPKGPR